MPAAAVDVDAAPAPTAGASAPDHDDGPRSAGAVTDRLDAPAGERIRRPPLVVGHDASVRDVARRMRESRTGAALIGDRPDGIVTDRDLRNRVVAEGLPPATTVHTVMTRPVVTVSVDTPLHEVLLLMVDRDLHHIPMTRGGCVVGMVTDKDLLREQAQGALLLLERINRAEDRQALAGYTSDLAATAAALRHADVAPLRIARIITSLNDALTRRLLELGERELGPPPCPYAWMALGSEGRMEQVLATDQDNAIAYRDDTAEASEYFAQLAERGVGGLLAAGFPPCPGGYMATLRREPLAAWRQQFLGWIERPEPEALLEAEVFFDFRAVHGGLSLEQLGEALRTGAGRPVFLHHMARAALRFRPPLGIMGRIRAEDGGLDLKRHGISAIVLIGRLAGIAAGSAGQHTEERLADGAAAGIVSRSGADGLVDALGLLTGLRLREQLRALEAGRPPDNTVRLDSLSAFERGRLRDAFRVIADVQSAIASRYRVEARP